MTQIFLQMNGCVPCGIYSIQVYFFYQKQVPVVLTQFIFTLISFLLIGINRHYITCSSLPFKNECSVNYYPIIHQFYCNQSHDYVPPFLRLLWQSTISPIPTLLNVHHFSDSNFAKMSTISPTPMLLKCPPFLLHDFILEKLKILISYI